MKFDKSILEDINIKSDIVELISKYTVLKHQGNNYVGLCPFHNEKSPSFFVNDIKKIYHCFGCGVGGNIITFFMNIENMSYKETILYLADYYNIQIKNDNENTIVNIQEKNIYLINKTTLEFFKTQLIENSQANYYLKNRKIFNETFNKFDIGYAPNNNELLNFLLLKYKMSDILESGLIGIKNEKIYLLFRNRIIFPIKNNNNDIVGFGGRSLNENIMPKYLNSRENIVFKKKYILYAIEKIINKKNDFLILVEGYLDVITLHSNGFKNTISSLGTSLTLEQLKLIKKYNNNLIIVFDNDQAGHNAIDSIIDKIVNNIKNFNVKIATIHSSKDPDEFINKFGIENFKEILKSSCPYIQYKINKIKYKYSDTIEENINNKYLCLKEIIVFLKCIQDPIEKTLYIKQISHEFNINLKNFVFKKNNIINENLIQEKNTSKFIKSEELIISILFNNFNNDTKKYISIIEKEFKNIDNYILEISNQNILKQIIYIYNKKGIINIFDLEEVLNDNELKHLIKITTKTLLINNINVAKIFDDCIVLLKLRYYKNNNLLEEFINLNKTKLKRKI